MTTGKFSSPQEMSGSSPFFLADEMAFDISHELRTPLTAIQVTLDLLESGMMGNLSEQGQRMVKIAASNAERLIRLTTAIEQQPETMRSYLSVKELAQLRLEADLRSALFRNELMLCYQPIVELETGKVVELEALLRWHHPAWGSIFPSTFIPLAEVCGLMIPIGNWAIREACRQLRIWQKQFPAQFSTFSISVNISGKQLLSSHLARQVEQTLREFRLEPQHLKLEVTESAVMENVEAAKTALESLHALGIQLYIDDFGTGYSCLSRLHQLPLDVLKVDRSFVHQLSSECGKYLIRAIVALAESVGMGVIAEGIETQEQALKLQQLGCDRGQGYWLAEPLTAEAVIALICD